MNPFLVIIGAQLLFTASDVLGRSRMVQHGFNLGNFLSSWFVLFVLLKVFAIVGQLYVFSQFELGKTIALFAVASIVLANVVGFLFLQEVLGTKEYVGVVLAVSAFLVIALAGK